MRVLLVYPEFPDTYWSFRHALSFEGKRSAFPPLGLLTVAALLPDTWERRLVDMNVQPLKTADIAWAELIFVSAMLTQKDALERVIARCKALGKRVVVGGPYVTTNAAALPQADHLFLGEAETTLPAFVSDLERGEPKRVYFDIIEMEITENAPATTPQTIANLDFSAGLTDWVEFPPSSPLSPSPVVSAAFATERTRHPLLPAQQRALASAAASFFSAAVFPALEFVRQRLDEILF